MKAAAELLEKEQEIFAQIITLEMGKPIRRGQGRDREMRQRMPLLCEQRGRVADAVGGADGRATQLYPLRSDRAGPGDHAVEFSFLAGLPFRRASFNGRQRLPAETRRQRAAMRARD